MAFQLDYNKILDSTSKRMALTAETYTGNRLDQSISSGMLCTDLLLGNGGFISGWNTSFGPEQGAKSTTAVMGLNEAFNMGIPNLQNWDFEKSHDVRYQKDMWNGGKLPEYPYGKQNAKGDWEIKPSIWGFNEHTAEMFFDYAHSVMKQLPKKVRIGSDWFQVFDKTKANQAMLKGNYSEALYKSLDKFCVPVENGRPQGYLYLDSYVAMLPEGMDGDEVGNAMAKQARMFSEQLKRVKGLIGSRNIVLVGINQLRLRPAVSFGNPEYEPGGEALKLFSDIRIMHRSCAVPKPYQNWGEVVKATDIRTEPAYYTPDSDGLDSYRFITLTVTKNKMGGAPKGTRVHQRIWVSDEIGTARGIDPVFDVYQYLILTGQAEGNLKSFTVQMYSDNPLNGQTLDLTSLKGLVVGNLDAKKEVCKSLGINSNPKIRDTCFKQLQSGEGYDLFKGKTVVEIKPVKISTKKKKKVV